MYGEPLGIEDCMVASYVRALVSLVLLYKYIPTVAQDVALEEVFEPMWRPPFEEYFLNTKSQGSFFELLIVV